MPQFMKKPIEIEAHQWFKNGDHPLDSDPHYVGREQFHDGKEGYLVRYYRHPQVEGATLCDQCHIRFHEHGWLDTLEDGHRVCPGDWIITGIKGEMYPCKPDIFEETYEELQPGRLAY